MTPPSSHVADHHRPLTLVEHLCELRDRLIRVVLAIGLGTFVGLLVSGHILAYFAAMIVHEPPLLAITWGTRVFLIIAFSIGVALAMPVILHQTIHFLAPGLTRTERRYVRGLLPGALLCFVGGIAFAVAVVLPQTLGFLLNPDTLRTRTTLRVTDLLSFCVEFALWTGIAFELPIMLFLCVTLDIISHVALRRMHKYTAVGLAILTALITPTFDVLIMLAIWLLLYLPFGLGLILSRFAHPPAETSTRH